MGSPNDIDTPFKNEVREAARDFVEMLSNLSIPRMFDPEQVAHITVAYFNVNGGLDKVMFVTTKEVVENGSETGPSAAHPGSSSSRAGRTGGGPAKGQ